MQMKKNLYQDLQTGRNANLLEELRWFALIVSISPMKYEVRASVEWENWGWELEV